MHNDSFGLALEERHILFAVLFLNAGACFTKQYFCKTNLYSLHSTVKANQRERSGGMPHPITIHHDSSALKQQHGITDRPDFCSYPIRGLPWDTVQHLDYRMSLQQEEFLGNHLQLVEMEAATETTLSFTVGFPSVFIAVMMEGFVKIYKHDELIA